MDFFSSFFSGARLLPASRLRSGKGLRLDSFHGGNGRFGFGFKMSPSLGALPGFETAAA